MTAYKIFPAIGIARVGNAPKKFYLGPETYRGLPINPDGRPFTEDDFRDDEGRLCKQAARFKLYRTNDDGVQEEVTLETDGVKSITWTVHLANKKPSWYLFQTSLGEDGYASNHPLRNAQTKNRHKLLIDAGPRQIAGRGKHGVVFDMASVPSGYRGAHFPPGKLHPMGEPLTSLGELRTDAAGRLIVLGGSGISGSTDPDAVITEYANNDDWWDDTSDGPVGAVIEFDDGTTVNAVSANVLIGPPAYAPEIPNTVTLYDTIFDAMVRSGHYPDIYANGVWKAGKDGYRPNYRTEIRPLLERPLLNTWVTAIPPKPHQFDFDKLGALSADKKMGAPEFKGLREYLLGFVRPPNEVNTIIDKNGPTLMPYLAGDNCLILSYKPSLYTTLTDTQFFFLQQWAEGWFDDVDPPDEPATQLTRAVLENCVGGPFSPGIEMTWISRNPQIYADSFRIRSDFVLTGPLSLDFDPQRGMQPGDLTRYMAVPWQADFNECSSQPLEGRTLWWWPAQRPEFVYLEPKKLATRAAIPSPDEDSGNQVAWIGTTFDQKASDFIMFANDVDMVKHWSELGFVMEKTVDGERRFVEVSRTLPRPFNPQSSS